MFEYRLIRSARRTIELGIKDGGLVVRAPYRAPLSEIERAISKSEAWIKKHLAAEAERNAQPPLTDGEIRALAARAAAYLPDRVRYYARLIGVEPARITVRCQKSKWGSCSAKGGLSFNCLLMLMPSETADAVVVHELCHLIHMDHSPAFYAEIARVMPDYAERKRWLNENGAALLARVKKQPGGAD